MRSPLLLAGCAAEVDKASRIGGHGFAHLGVKEYQLVVSGVHAPDRCMRRKLEEAAEI